MVASKKISIKSKSVNKNMEANSKQPIMRQKLNLIIVLLAITTISVLIISVLAEHHDDHKHHKYNPYKYGYKVIDHKGNKQWKQEESHHPMEVKGSYGYKDKHGMFREVSYIADKHGFRAHVKTNEPGTAPKSSAGVKMDAHPEPAFHKSNQGHETSHGHN